MGLYGEASDGSTQDVRAEASGPGLTAFVGGQILAEVGAQDLRADAAEDWDPKNRAFADEAAAADAAALALAKPLADGAGAADAVQSLGVDKALADGAEAADAFSRVVAFVRAFTDGAGAADTLTITSIIRGGAISEATIGGHP